jgi:hypothetical protein
MADLSEAAQGGRATAPLDCGEVIENGSPIGERACLRLLASLGPNRIQSVEDCRGRPDAAGGCTKIRAPPVDIEFEYRRDPLGLLRIRVSSIRDARIVRPQIPRGTEN